MPPEQRAHSSRKSHRLVCSASFRNDVSNGLPPLTTAARDAHLSYFPFASLSTQKIELSFFCVSCAVHLPRAAVPGVASVRNVTHADVADSRRIQPSSLSREDSRRFGEFEGSFFFVSFPQTLEGGTSRDSVSARVFTCTGVRGNGPRGKGEGGNR